MSLHNVPSGVDPEKLLRLLDKHLRASSGVVMGDLPQGTPPAQIEFTPDLTPQEAATLANLFSMAASAVEWQPSDYAVFKQQKDVLANYLTLTNPSAAQRLAMEKALIRVIRAIARE